MTSSEPIGSLVVKNVATPKLEGLTIPNVVLPRVKATGLVLPLGSPPLLLRVAVNLTDLPVVDGFGDEDKVSEIRA